MANFADLPRDIKHLVLSQNPEALRASQRLNRETRQLTHDDYLRYNCTKPITPNEVRQYLNTYPYNFGYFSVINHKVMGTIYEVHKYSRLSSTDEASYAYTMFTFNIIDGMPHGGSTHTGKLQIRDGIINPEHLVISYDIPLAYSEGEIVMFDMSTTYEILRKRSACHIYKEWPTLAKELSFNVLSEISKLLNSTNDPETYYLFLHLYQSYIKLVADVLYIRNNLSDRYIPLDNNELLPATFNQITQNKKDEINSVLQQIKEKFAEFG